MIKVVCTRERVGRGAIAAVLVYGGAATMGTALVAGCGSANRTILLSARTATPTPTPTPRPTPTPTATPTPGPFTVAFTNLTSDANEINPPSQAVTFQDASAAVTTSGQVTGVNFEIFSTATNPQYEFSFAVVNGSSGPIVAGETIAVETTAGTTTAHFVGSYDERNNSTGASKFWNITGGTITIDSISPTSLSLHGTVTMTPAGTNATSGLGSFTANFTATGIALGGG